MRYIFLSLLAIAFACSGRAQVQTTESPADTATVPRIEVALPFHQTISAGDLIAISVYDSPEESHAVRVDPDGGFRLPMVKERIQAAGLSPAELEEAIASALNSANVLLNPVVSVSVTESPSRTITVVGAVRTPGAYVTSGTSTLLDILSRAGGLTEAAGPDILVSREVATADAKSVVLTERVAARKLIDTVAPALNLRLDGGEVIRVPEAGRIFVAGNVAHPGIVPVMDDGGTSVMKAVSLSGGLAPYSGHTAYIYRIEAGSGGRNEIPVNLRKILARKSPDVVLMPNDIFYVPDSSGRRFSDKALTMTLGFGLGVAGLMLAIFH